jgi:hypothetical protein
MTRSQFIGLRRHLEQRFETKTACLFGWLEISQFFVVKSAILDLVYSAWWFAQEASIILIALFLPASVSIYLISGQNT